MNTTQQARVRGGRMACGCAIALYRRPDIIRTRVKGAPFQPRTWVRVVSWTDHTGRPDLLGCKGLVHHLNYNGLTGNTYPRDPLIRVRLLATGVAWDFWAEELEAIQ